MPTRLVRALLILAALVTALPALASTLPWRFVLGKVTESWDPQRDGIALEWTVQAYEAGAPSGPAQPGTLSLRGGKVRAEYGDGEARVVRVYDNAAAAVLEHGRVTRLAPETRAMLPEGLFLRGRDSLESIFASLGVDPDQASWGRMPTVDAEITFHPVVRYGAPAGADDLSIPQVWIDTHRFTLQRVVTTEGGKALVVDYGGHGAVDKAMPWLPQTFEVRLDGQVVWTARVSRVLDKAPPEKGFSLEGLEAEASR